MAQRRAQPRHQFADAEGLFDIVVGAEIERLDLLRLAVARRENDDRHFRKLPDVAQNVLAVAVGQTEVEHDHVRRLAHRRPQRIRRRLRCNRLVACGRQRDFQEALDLRLVVDDENALSAHGSLRGFVGASAAGRRTTMRVPRRRTAGLCAAIVPPMASTSPLQIDRPSPVPALRPSGRPPR